MRGGSFWVRKKSPMSVWQPSMSSIKKLSLDYGKASELQPAAAATGVVAVATAVAAGGVLMSVAADALMLVAADALMLVAADAEAVLAAVDSGVALVAVL